MPRTLGRLAGLLLVIAGLAVLLPAMALPWARYRVDADVTVAGSDLRRVPADWVFQVSGGWWFLGLLAVLVTLLAGALAGEPRWRPACGGLALLGGLAGTGLALTIAARADALSRATSALGFADIAVHGQAGPGAYCGAAATVLLGLGASLASLAGDRSGTRVAPVSA